MEWSEWQVSTFNPELKGCPGCGSKKYLQRVIRSDGEVTWFCFNPSRRPATFTKLRGRLGCLVSGTHGGPVEIRNVRYRREK